MRVYTRDKCAGIENSAPTPLTAHQLFQHGRAQAQDINKTAQGDFGTKTNESTQFGGIGDTSRHPGDTYESYIDRGGRDGLAAPRDGLAADREGRAGKVSG